jgi:transposase
MGYIRGKPLEPGERRAIVSIKGYFDRNRKDWGVNESSAQLTADALAISISTVKRVMAEYHRDPSSLEKVPEPKGRPSYAIDQSHEEAVRGLIRQANQQGQHITLATISEFIQAHDPELSFHRATLARTLDRWGFEFGQGKKSQHLKEKDEIVAYRRRYLRRMRANRDHSGHPIRPDVYLDESYVNKNHSNDFIWYSDEDGPWVQKPSGKGERLILVHAMSENGWIDRNSGRELFRQSWK